MDNPLNSAPTAEFLSQENKSGSELYWKNKDAAGCFAHFNTAIRRVRDFLAGGGELNGNAQLEYKMLLYNTASYGWLGWHEPGIELSPEFQREASICAREHLEICRNLELPPIKMSRGHWIVGALAIQEKAYEAARDHFEAAARFAMEAAKPEEAMNGEAFAILCDVLQERPGAKAKLEAHLRMMSQDDSAKDFVDQPKTALRVFCDGASGADSA